MTNSFVFMQDALLQIVYRVGSHLGYPTSGSEGGKALNELPKGRVHMLVTVMDSALSN